MSSLRLTVEGRCRVSIAGKPTCEILIDAEMLAHHAANWLVKTLSARDCDVAVALAGGSTPRLLYRCLAAPPHRDAFPWSRTHWFWGDERFVPHTNPDSNFRMVCETLFAHAPVPAANIHPVPTEGLDIVAAAAAYEQTLQSHYGSHILDPTRPLFDVTLLGLGADGHTASLFSGSRASHEHAHWVTAVTDTAIGPRITLTYPALACSRNVAILVTGADKRAILGRFLAGDPTLPASKLHPVESLRLFVDAAADPTGVA